MTSKLFELTAKNELMHMIRDDYEEEYGASEIHMVWFCRILGSMKGLFIDDGKNKRYYEVTYNFRDDEMYIDVYEKTKNMLVGYVSRGVRRNAEQNFERKHLLQRQHEQPDALSREHVLPPDRELRRLRTHGRKASDCESQTVSAERLSP